MEFLGHEIWIEGPDHGHLGGLCDLLLKYGHNLTLDGRVDPSRVTATLMTPQGGHADLVLFSKPDLITDAYVVSFSPVEEGFYTVWLDYAAGIWCESEAGNWYYGEQSRCPEVKKAMRYRQFSKIILPVGHGLAPTTPDALGTTMDIVPQDFHSLSEGEELTVQVIYQGKPLPEADLRIAGGENKQVFRLKADSQGFSTIKFDSFGHWMILAGYDDYNCGIPGKFEAEQFSTVLSLKVRI